MYFYLVQNLKRRLIIELKDSFSRHPIYKKLVPNIQNRFAFKERPNHGIVVKGSNANKVQLAADNFVGTVQSHVMLANVGPHDEFPLEWVKEDLSCVRDFKNKNNGVGFPTPPGIYFVEILQVPTNPGESGTFAIDPLLTVENEPVLRFQSGIEREAQLQNVPSEGTLRLWENYRFLLREGVDYNLGERGAIELLSSFAADAVLTADYRYPAESLGPIEWRWNTADFKTLPGVVMAFGKRAEVGHKVAIVVTPERVDAAEAFGGKHEISFDLDVITRDTTQMEEIADLVIMFLWGQKKAPLEYEGIEILDVNMGGEAEELYDETGDLYYYTASMSVQLRADWEIHVPLPLTISRVTPSSASAEASTTVTTVGGSESNLQMVSNDLFYQTHPVIVGRNSDFERIG